MRHGVLFYFFPELIIKHSSLIIHRQFTIIDRLLKPIYSEQGRRELKNEGGARAEFKQEEAPFSSALSDRSLKRGLHKSKKRSSSPHSRCILRSGCTE